MQRKPGADLSRQPGDSEVLNEDGVGAGPGDVRQRLPGDRKLAVEDQGVEGDEPLHALGVEEIEDPGQLGRRDSRAPVADGGLEPAVGNVGDRVGTLPRSS